jgi:hypothetical protein
MFNMREMKKIIILFLLISFCGGDDDVTDVEDSAVINSQFNKFTPINCDGDGVGCEKLYLQNANVGWRDTENKYCEESSIRFYFEEEFNLDFITVQNFQDDKFNKSAKPRALVVWGPIDEDMQYGGHREVGELLEIKEQQTIEIPEDWPPITEVLISIQSGYFTPTSVDYCGLQNLEFYGYSK